MTPRAAFLRALPACGLVPPAAGAAAAVVPADPAGCFARRVDEFAAGFWLLSPDAREVGWRALAATAAGPAAARLADLRPGLGVGPGSPRGPDAAAVAALACELVVLAPRARAARRAAWLAGRAADDARWQAAGREALRADPRLEELDPQLFHWLRGGTAPAPVAAADPAVLRGPGRVVTAVRAAWPEAKWVLAALVAVVASAALVLGLAHAFARSRPRPTPPRPPDPYSTPASAPFTADEVWEFREYEAGGRVGVSPFRWLDWVRAGRPPAGDEP